MQVEIASWFVLRFDFRLRFSKSNSIVRFASRFASRFATLFAFCVARSQITVAKRKISRKTNEICTTVGNGGTNFSTTVFMHLDLIFSNETSHINNLNIFLQSKSKNKFFHPFTNFVQPFCEVWVFLRLNASRKTQN